MQRAILCPTLVGRSEELETLVGALEAGSTGTGTVGLVLGVAGIGKSRLVRETAAEARRRQLSVLAGRATQTGSPVPFRPLSEAFLAHLRAVGATSDAYRTPALQPFLPALGRLIPAWRQNAASAVDDSIVVLGEAVLRLLRTIGDVRGCLLVLEDLHWADPETLAVVEYLSDNLQSEPIVCLGTLRVEEPSTALRLARTLQARRTGLVLELSRLSDGEVEQMGRCCLATAHVPDAVDRLLRSSADGLPLLIEDLLAAAIGSEALVHQEEGWSVQGRLEPVVPLTFADTVAQRLQALNAEPRQVLQAAALLGRYFDWTLLPPVTGLEERSVLDGLRRAAHAQLVEARAQDAQTQFRFRHALTRDAVLAGLLPPERAAMARRALEVVENVHPGLPEEWSELGAELAGAAGDLRRAAELLLEVGRRALGSGALVTAEMTLDRARDCSVDDPALLAAIDEALTEVLALAGKTDRVIEVGETLLGTLEAIDAAPERRAQAHLLLARAATTANQWERAEEHLAQARLLAVEGSASSLAPHIDALGAQVAIGAQRPDEAAALARAAFSAAEREGLPEVACEALEVIGRCARLHDRAQARAAFERARAVAEEHGLAVWQIRAMLELGTIDLLSGAPLDRLRQTRELALRAGALATVCVIDLQIAAGSLLVGDYPGSLESAQRCADIARRFHLGPVLGMDLALEAEAYLLLGRDPEAESALQEALAVAGDYPDIAASVRAERANLALLREDRDVALHELDAAMELARRAPSMSPHPFRGLWALLKAVEGPDGDAACAQLRASGATVQLVNQGYLSYAEAVLLGRQGRRAEAESAFTRGDAAMRDMPWYRNQARRIVAEAAIRDGWGDPVAWLREAIPFFQGQGQERMTSACRSLLRKAGAPAPRKGRGESDVPTDLRARGVTSREMDVLLLLAKGLSNREIAAQLFLSPRTVERHVENLTTKLDIQGRSQLIAFAASRAAASPTG